MQQFQNMLNIQTFSLRWWANNPSAVARVYFRWRIYFARMHLWLTHMRITRQKRRSSVSLCVMLVSIYFNIILSTTLPLLISVFFAIHKPLMLQLCAHRDCRPKCIELITFFFHIFFVYITCSTHTRIGAQMHVVAQFDYCWYAHTGEQHTYVYIYSLAPAVR